MAFNAKNWETEEEVDARSHLNIRTSAPFCLEREMNCEEARNLISAYFDGELSSDSRSSVSKHLGSCPTCTEELASFESLSKQAANLEHPMPPDQIWQNVEAQLNVENTMSTVREETNLHRFASSRWLSIAALLLVALSLAYFGYENWHHAGHDELAADFSEYLDVFQDNPSDAHLVLVNKYAGKTVQLDQAHTELGYKPTLVAGLPDGYTVQSSFVMEMPCCKCIKTVCKRSDGGTLAIFEHNDEQPIWFGDRPSVQTECGGEPCTLTQLDGNVAVSWKQGSRHLTAVGAKDVEEAAALIEHFAASAPG